MKKLLMVMAVAGFMAACNNEADSTADQKDSIDSAANQRIDAIDSSAEARKNVIDSAAEAKKEAIDSLAERRDSANRDNN